MASRRYTAGVAAVIDQAHDLDQANKIVGVLIRSGSSVPTEDVATVGAFATLNKCRDSGYSSQILTGAAWSRSGTKVILDANDPVFGNAGSHASDEIIGILWCIYTGATEANWIPLNFQIFVDGSGTAQSKYLTGTSIKVEIPTDGLFHINCPASTVRLYTAGLLAVANNTHNLETASKLNARLLKTTTSALSDNPATVGAFTTLDETTDSGYSKQTLTSVNINSGTAGTVKVTADNLAFPNSGGGGQTVRYMLTSINIDGGNADIPLSLQRLDNDWTFNGANDLPVYLPSVGILAITV